MIRQRATTIAFLIQWHLYGGKGHYAPRIWRSSEVKPTSAFYSCRFTVVLLNYRVKCGVL